MTIQNEGWRKRQERVLTKFREDSGRGRDEIAHDANLTYWRYVRFEEGKSSLPAECVVDLERAYGLIWGELSEALGLVPKRLTLRDRLDAGGLSDDEIREALSEAAGKDLGPAEERHWAELWIARVERMRQAEQRASS